MSTSGVYTLGRTVNQLATETFDIMQVGTDGETLDGDMIGRFKTAANLVLKEWKAQGLHIWTTIEGSLFLTVGQESYDFRDSTTHAANTWYETTTTAATTALSNEITVYSISNIQVGDVIGIIQNDNNLFWTTVSFTPSGFTVKLTDSIPLATPSGAAVRNYRVGTATAPELKPISRVLNVRRKESTYEVPVAFQSRQEYFSLPNKDQTGTPIQTYYSREDVAGEVGGIMYVWNSPSSSVPVINFTYERKVQVITSGEETIDIPDYAQQAFVYACAVRLTTKMGISQSLAQRIRSEYELLRNDMLSYGSTVYPIKVKMNG